MTWTMSDLSCICLFKIIAVLLFLINHQQYQHGVSCVKLHQQQQLQHQLHHNHHQQSAAQQQQLQKLHRQNHHQPRTENADAAAASAAALSSYATSLAYKYLSETSALNKPNLNLVKREIKFNDPLAAVAADSSSQASTAVTNNNNKKTDIISYINDFNMQDEASIPEDLFDQQHLHELEDGEGEILGTNEDMTNEKNSMKTTTNDVKSAPKERVQGDMINVNLPTYDGKDNDDDDDDKDKDKDNNLSMKYQNSRYADDDKEDNNSNADTDAEADIILASQRSSEKNFHSNEFGKQTGRDEWNQEEDIGYIDEDVQNGYSKFKADLLNFKETNNKKEVLKDNRQRTNNKVSSNANNNIKLKVKDKSSLTKSSVALSYADNFPKMEKLNDDADWELEILNGDDDEDDDDDDGSAEYEKFKSMHERQQKLKEQQKLQQELRAQIEKDRQKEEQIKKEKEIQKQKTTQQMLTIMKLNEGKLNNPLFQSSLASSYSESPMAVSSFNINENFLVNINKNNKPNGNHNKNNDDTSADAAATDDDDDSDDTGNHNYDEKPKSYNKQQQQNQQQEQPKDAIGDIVEESSYKSKTSKEETAEKLNGGKNMFITRKWKRHNGAARLEDATNRYTRYKQEKLQQQSEQHEHDDSFQHQNSKEAKTNSIRNIQQINNERNDELLVEKDKATELSSLHQQANDFSITVTSNDTNSPEYLKNENYFNNFKDNSTYSRQPFKMNMEGSSSNGITHVRDNVAAAGAADENDESKDKDIRQQVRNQHITTFEREKSLRRNNRRYGHKTHKKKYKDYLRHSSSSSSSSDSNSRMMRTKMLMMTTEMPVTTASSGSSNSNTQHAMQTDKASVGETVVGLTHSSFTDQKEDLNINSLKDKHREKLQLEKLRKQYPSSPIFVVKQQQQQQHQDKQQSQAKQQAPLKATFDATSKPFYEGQINYFMETDDDDDEAGGAIKSRNEAKFINKGERMDPNDWYRKLSPVLRNGVKSSSSNSNQDDKNAGFIPYHHYKPQQQQAQHQQHLTGEQHYFHGSPHNRHHHRHHQQHNQHSQQQQHHNQQHGSKHSRHHAYQRKMLPKNKLTMMMTSTTPIPPPSLKQQQQQLSQHSQTTRNPMHDLGHQITDIKDFERYYAKWPHLARVQSQLRDEHMREQHSDIYRDDYDYENAGYMDDFQAASSNNPSKEQENLPPYIRKYNKRNKQLLDLLEGPIIPPVRPLTPHQLRWSGGSKLQPGPRDTAVGSMTVRIDDDYLKEKRKRYHQRQRQIHDLFAQQRNGDNSSNNGTTTTTATALLQTQLTMAPTPAPPATAITKATKELQYHSINTNTYPIQQQQQQQQPNHLPDEDVSVSQEHNDENDNVDDEQHIWQTEIETKAKTLPLPNGWQLEEDVKTTSAKTEQLSSSTLKPAVYKLPSYPSIAGSFMSRPRSRSAQFAPSSGSLTYRKITAPATAYMSNNNNNFINAGGFVAFNGAANAFKSARLTAAANEKKSNSLTPSAAAVSTTKTNKYSSSSSSSSSSALDTSPSTAQSVSSASASPSTISSVRDSFVYHRVVDASPRFVGAGLTGRKQRLPFVAITDRRLETSKKSSMLMSMSDHDKVFEQNHYPLP